MSISDAVIVLHKQVRSMGLDGSRPRFRFSRHYIDKSMPIREGLAKAGLKDWVFDMAWPDIKLCVDIDRFNNFEKKAKAIELGWLVYDCRQGMVTSGAAIHTIEMVHSRLVEINSREDN